MPLDDETIQPEDEDKNPGLGAGKYGVASEFGNLDGWTQKEADRFLKTLNPKRIHTTQGGYTYYVFQDGTEVIIGPDLKIDRYPRIYNPDGSRAVHMRLDRNGEPQVRHTFEEEQLRPDHDE